MTGVQKRIAVIVAATEPARLREALRAAVGLTLRGDAVEVALLDEPPAGDPAVTRALGTLRALGHDVVRGPAAAVTAARAADATEVWT